MNLVARVLLGLDPMPTPAEIVRERPQRGAVQAECLRLLVDPDGMYASDIAEAIGCDYTTVARALQALRDKGLTRSIQEPWNGRPMNVWFRVEEGVETANAD